MQPLLTAMPKAGVNDRRVDGLSRRQRLRAHRKEAMIRERKFASSHGVLEVVVCTKFGLELVLLPQLSNGQKAVREVRRIHYVVQNVVLGATILVSEFESDGSDTLSTHLLAIRDSNIHRFMLVIYGLEE